LLQACINGRLYGYTWNCTNKSSNTHTHIHKHVFLKGIGPDAPPRSLKDSNVNPKVKTMEEVGVHSLAHNTLGVKGRVGTSGWGLGWMTSGSIIHTDLHKPNDKLVSV
jgi:hypothetical protein